MGLETLFPSRRDLFANVKSVVDYRSAESEGRCGDCPINEPTALHESRSKHVRTDVCRPGAGGFNGGHHYLLRVF